MGRDMIKIPAPLAFSSQVSGNCQFANDSLGSPFGNLQGGGNIAKPYTGITRDQQERIAVIRQQPKIGYWG
jgi:hypothetical protein